jgi:hypothetical protein
MMLKLYKSKVEITSGVYRWMLNVKKDAIGTDS